MTRRPKRFYEDVSTKDEDGGASLLLDDKPVRTPGKVLLSLPNRQLAEAVADEWRAQRDRIDPASMPLTKLANSAIDGVSGQEQAVISDIVAFASADLLCYRAEGPDGLLARQAKHWDPVLAWAREVLGAPFVQAQGITHIAQPQVPLAKVRRVLEGFDDFGLAALHVMTMLTGSALLALAVALGKITPEAAWEAAHVDEDWQIAQWGEDAEAAARRQARQGDFEAAAKMLRLLGG